MNRSLRRQGVVHAGRGRYVVWSFRAWRLFRAESHGREWVVSVDGFDKTFACPTARKAIRRILEVVR